MKNNSSYGVSSTTRFYKTRSIVESWFLANVLTVVDPLISGNGNLSGKLWFAWNEVPFCNLTKEDLTQLRAELAALGNLDWRLNP